MSAKCGRGGGETADGRLSSGHVGGHVSIESNPAISEQIGDRTGPPARGCDARSPGLGGAPGEDKARAFDVYGYAFVAHKPQG